jgi:hypothetical protein
MSYNGWSNWETWNAKVWMDNEEGVQREMERVAARGADALRDYFEEAFGPADTLTGPLGDAWSMFLSEVDWREIAENVMGDMEPTCDICGEPEDHEDGRENDWNGETGNHLSCEAV